MKLKIITFIILLLTLTFSATITTISCYNETTQLTNTTYDNGTQELTYTPCPYSCTSGSCFDSEQQINYSWLFVIAVSIVLGLCIFILTKSNNEMFRYLTFIFALLLLITLLITVGGLGNQIGERIGNMITYVGWVIGLIFTFLFSMIIWQFIKDSLRSKEE